MSVRITCEEIAGELPKFWASTGFTPAEWLLDEEMRMAVDLLGSIPNGGMRHARIHLLLDLVEAKGLGTDDPAYDWSSLDEAIDVLVRNDLRPFFELMGNPSDHFSDFTDPDEIAAWRRLVADLVDHLVGRYGAKEVESWYFECWNEPDVGWGWDQFRWSTDALCNYYDACDAGLRDAEGSFTLGGPGTAAGRTPADEREPFRAFVRHCAEGDHYFLDEDGATLDFISVHEKGATSHEEDLTPDSAGILERERSASEWVADRYPEFDDRPLVNNECDPQTGWSDTHTWRARAYYAAFVAKVVCQHVDGLLDGHDREYALLSNDNGFLGSWGNRTHFARIGDDEHDRGAVELLKKPVHNVMTLLSYLDGRRIGTSLDAPGGPDGNDRDVGALATRPSDEQVAVLLYHCDDRPHVSDGATVDVEIPDLPFESCVLDQFRIDADHGNPFARWEAMGAPDSPSDEQLAALRREHELARLRDPEPVSVAGGFATTLTLPAPGVSLLLLSERPAGGPAPVTNLDARTKPGTTFGSDVLLTWDDVEDRTIETYEVLRADDPDGAFERINETDIVATAYVDARNETDATDVYAVRAVDYWGRTGGVSDPVRPEAGR